MMMTALTRPRSRPLTLLWWCFVLCASFTVLVLFKSLSARDAHPDRLQPEPVSSGGWAEWWRPWIGDGSRFYWPEINDGGRGALGAGLGGGAGAAPSWLKQSLGEGGVLSPRKEDMTIMTFNIRYDSGAAFPRMPYPPSGPKETFPRNYFGEYSWNFRRHGVADVILMHNPDIVFLQEVLYNQLQDLAYLLGDEYTWVGVGRNDAHSAGEAVPVFWKKNKYALVPEAQGGVGAQGVEHFWLSPTPDKVGSVGWDAAQTRMCTHLSLRLINPQASSPADLSLHAPMHIFSTHYDHIGHLARAESSKLIVSRADAARKRLKALWKDLSRAQGSDAGADVEPLIILGGDLNSPREERGWQNLVKGHYGVAKDKDTPLSFFDLQLSVPTRFGLTFPTDHFPLTEEDPYTHPLIPDYDERGNIIRPKTSSSELRNTLLKVAESDSMKNADFSKLWPYFDSKSMRPATWSPPRQPRPPASPQAGAAGARLRPDRVSKRSPTDIVGNSSSSDHPSMVERQTSPHRNTRGILSTAFGPPASFTDWTPTRDRSVAEDRIDFIFVADNHNLVLDGSQPQAQKQAQKQTQTQQKGAKKGWRLKTAGVLSNRARGEGGILISDHRPVMARLQWDD